MCSYRTLSRRTALTAGAAALLSGVPFARAAAAAPPAGEDAAFGPAQALPKPPPSTAEQVVTKEDEQIADLLRRGATMEEIAQARGGSPVKSPQDALRLLKVGNARFFSGQGRPDDLSAQERRAQVLGQSPYAVILGCSDSRVPTEIVFDQTLGDLFAVRVAGNVAEPATVASVQYAVTHLKSKLVVVMGHEGCGAVKAAMLSAEQRRGEPKPVQSLLDMIVPAVSYVPKIRDRKAKEREAVVANVRLQSYALSQDPVLKELVAKNEVGIVGAFYEITSGIVDFYETPDEMMVEKEVATAAGLPVPPGAPSVAGVSTLARG